MLLNSFGNPVAKGITSSQDQTTPETNNITNLDRKNARNSPLTRFCGLFSDRDDCCGGRSYLFIMFCPYIGNSI